MGKHHADCHSTKWQIKSVQVLRVQERWESRSKPKWTQDLRQPTAHVWAPPGTKGCHRGPVQNSEQSLRITRQQYGSVYVLIPQFHCENSAACPCFRGYSTVGRGGGHGWQLFSNGSEKKALYWICDFSIRITATTIINTKKNDKADIWRVQHSVVSG